MNSSQWTSLQISRVALAGLRVTLYDTTVEDHLHDTNMSNPNRTPNHKAINHWFAFVPLSRTRYTVCANNVLDFRVSCSFVFRHTHDDMTTPCTSLLRKHVTSFRSWRASPWQCTDYADPWKWYVWSVRWSDLSDVSNLCVSLVFRRDTREASLWFGMDLTQSFWLQKKTLIITGWIRFKKKRGYEKAACGWQKDLRIWLIR